MHIKLERADIRKYCFTGETRVIEITTSFNGENVVVERHTLHRIKALRDIDNPHRKIFAGEVGGWIESEDNLPQTGRSWVANNAQVYGDAKLSNRTLVCDSAEVFGKAAIKDRAYISENARVYGSATISENAKVRGRAEVSGLAVVTGHAIIDGRTHVYGNAHIYGIITLNGKIEIFGTTVLYGDNIAIKGDIFIF